ncbi:dynamin family protein [Helicobacter pylori]|uniref:dynamin family protein n=1 Tax=Helicobacter pylori TaxID=210 RepID=UPI001F0E6B1B|nr:dynamin family protein [Helicobacter pylori]MCH4609786.1 dynamin family protein [Helicobacter pylori]
MNAQELIQKSALIEKTLKEQGLQERARPFISENAVIKTEELEKTLKEMQDTDRDLKVGIIGRVKAGKSSLLNALIFEGKEVLPKAATPMTASLTVLKYAKTLSAEVEFYSPKDITELKNEHARYEREFQRIVEEEVKKQKEKQNWKNKAKDITSKIVDKFSKDKSDKEAPKEKILSDEEIRERVKRIAKDALSKDTRLVSSHDQYERMQKSGLTDTETLDSHIHANSLEELHQKLLPFVGANGKYMPSTKAVEISLNNPNLKNLEIIDTPGVNDPIVSREERTKALLKDCHVVFIISPSGQFLTGSDMGLFDRVSNKEGLQEIYFVASQADSVVCGMSVAAESGRHLPTALEMAQKSLSSSLDKTMEGLIQTYPNQREIFEKAIKNGVILTSVACFSMYKDFKNQASWESKKEEYYNAWRNLTNAYPDAFNSVDKSKESLLLLSNMGAIRERLEKDAQKKEEIISQRLQDYAKSQANNLSSLVEKLLEELELEKDRIRMADLKKIFEQMKEYEKLSDRIKTDFKDVYEKFVIDFINKVEDDLNETLKEFIKNAEENSKKLEREKEDTDVRSRETKKDVPFGSVARFFGNLLGESSWGYDKKDYYVKIKIKDIKAGAVVDYLIEMHEICKKALNDSVGSFKIVFKKELYDKVFPVLRKIINDDSLIDEVAFKKSVMAVLDNIKFEEFDYTLPSEIRAQTGLLKGDEALQFIQSVGTHLRDFEAETASDVKEYCTDLENKLGKQDFASGVLSKLKNDMQNLKNQVQNKEQSIAQLDAQIKALREI